MFDIFGRRGKEETNTPVSAGKRRKETKRKEKKRLL
jgi:hypothetical protein